MKTVNIKKNTLEQGGLYENRYNNLGHLKNDVSYYSITPQTYLILWYADNLILQRL